MAEKTKTVDVNMTWFFTPMFILWIAFSMQSIAVRAEEMVKEMRFQNEILLKANNLERTHE